jgi:hypothetical protein
MAKQEPTYNNVAFTTFLSLPPHRCKQTAPQINVLHKSSGLLASLIVMLFTVFPKNPGRNAAIFYRMRERFSRFLCSADMPCNFPVMRRGQEAFGVLQKLVILPFWMI